MSLMRDYGVYERPPPPPMPHPSGLSQAAIHQLTVPSTSTNDRHTDVYKADFLRRIVRREIHHHVSPQPGRRSKAALLKAAAAHAAMRESGGVCGASAEPSVTAGACGAAAAAATATTAGAGDGGVGAPHQPPAAQRSTLNYASKYGSHPSVFFEAHGCSSYLGASASAGALRAATAHARLAGGTVLCADDAAARIAARARAPCGATLVSAKALNLAHGSVPGVHGFQHEFARGERDAAALLPVAVGHAPHLRLSAARTRPLVAPLATTSAEAHQAPEAMRARDAALVADRVAALEARRDLLRESAATAADVEAELDRARALDERARIRAGRKHLEAGARSCVCAPSRVHTRAPMRGPHAVRTRQPPFSPRPLPSRPSPPRVALARRRV